MFDSITSIFVDESGRFQYPDVDSPYYIISLLLHDQGDDIRPSLVSLDTAFSRLGLSNVCFHAGPLIRQDGPFAFMDWDFRRRIFAAMLAFARSVPFHYRCLVVDKRLVASRGQMVASLSAQLARALDHIAAAGAAPPSGRKKFKIYYDCGQTPVTHLLHTSFCAHPALDAVFAQAVQPRKYRLFQLADMLCTLKLVELKLNHGEPLTESENKFFGGPRNFRRNWLRPIKRREI